MIAALVLIGIVVLAIVVAAVVLRCDRYTGWQIILDRNEWWP